MVDVPKRHFPRQTPFCPVQQFAGGNQPRSCFHLFVICPYVADDQTAEVFSFRRARKQAPNTSLKGQRNVSSREYTGLDAPGASKG